jgi:hypothetical protein
MAEWLKDHVAVICSLNLGLINGLWSNWRPGRVLRWKVETVSREGRGVVCGKPAPPRLWSLPVVGAHKTPISCANISSKCMK